MPMATCSGRANLFFADRQYFGTRTQRIHGDVQTLRRILPVQVILAISPVKDSQHPPRACFLTGKENRTNCRFDMPMIPGESQRGLERAEVRLSGVRRAGLP